MKTHIVLIIIMIKNYLKIILFREITDTLNHLIIIINYIINIMIKVEVVFIA